MKKICACFCALFLLCACGGGEPHLLQLDDVQEGDTLAIMETDFGEITIRLFPEEAPKAVENFTTHAEEGYYDGLTFHRVINGFMIQGGDPAGDGSGGESIWGGTFEDEFSDQLYNFNGVLSMANRGEDTNGSQFFIVQQQDGSQYGDETMDANYEYPSNVVDQYQKVGGTPWLDGVHTVFGQVVDGMDVVNAIASVRVDENSKPLEDVVIHTIRIETADAQRAAELNA